MGMIASSTLNKYLVIFLTSWQGEFAYRLNFILWRFRNVLRFLMTYFLWSGVFLYNNQVFGYSQPQILTYVFMILVVSTIVLSAPSADNIGGEIANGDLSNYLVKPVNYLKFWFVRDLSSKLLNLSFAAIEVSLLWLLLRPQIQLPSHATTLFFFLVSCIIAILINYLISVSARLVAFWTPESTWGVAFIVIVLMETLGGGVFPLDIMPTWVQFLLNLTPFPYLLYFPVAIFVEKITGVQAILVIAQSLVWVLVMLIFTNWLWRKGLLVYGSEGR